MEQVFLFESDENGAAFSECRKYRYALWRIWDKTLPLVMFIGLNPSTANENTDDPTIRRVISMAKAWGYGGVYMMNCFPFVTAYPDQLLIDHFTQVMNNTYLEKIGNLCQAVVFAWGNFHIVKKVERDIELKAMFPEALALVVNKDGSPRHPLYVPSRTKPVQYAAAPATKGERE